MKRSTRTLTHKSIITMQKTSPKKAFTLIELSIVVVIIGLLIAGISVGKSLVKSSRLSSARSITLSSQIVTIPGMVLWLENSSKDSFNTGQIKDGAAVTSWVNLEPSSNLTKNNLTTATASVTYKDNSTNNIPAIGMDVAGNMSVASFANSTTLSTSTIIIVFKPTAALNSTAKTIVDSGSAGSTTSIGIKSDRVVLNAGTLVETSTITNPAAFVASNSYILMVYFNGASSKVFSNNITEVGGSGAVLNAGTNSLSGLTIGADKTPANGIAAEISEVIIYNRILKDTERSDVMSYLAKKYKITVTGI